MKLDSGYLWLGLYFILNLSLTLYNKAILNNFRFPWTLTAIHTLCGTIGCYLLYQFGYFIPARLGKHEDLVMLMFSALYTINIAISNVSLNLVSVSFHQVIRAMTPVFTIIISIAFLQKSYSAMTYISLFPVVIGVAFATFGEYDYTFIGFFLTILGTLLASIKTIVTNRIQVGRLKLNPLDLLLRLSPLAFLQCLMYAYATGELSKVSEFSATHMTSNLMLGLLMNGVIAFALNIVSFTANKKTSALTMTVAGNVKQVLSITLAVMIFNININFINACGIFLTLLGGAWYGYVELSQKKTNNSPHLLPTMISTDIKHDLINDRHSHTLSEKNHLVNV
ncbi:triose-phosphate transporter family-domain-containing protein [Pilobolus umbonatus]|nr:triose-phosphate transporter family-domain-containing protein [Pilobolus umbonatus]